MDIIKGRGHFNEFAVLLLWEVGWNIYKDFGVKVERKETKVWKGMEGKGRGEVSLR